MFIYSGKLQYQSYGKDELFVVALPNGPVRLGDTVYFFFQWTADAKGVKKGNWFQKLIVDKISKTDNGEDTFHLPHHYYSYQVTAQPGYQGLAISMANPNGYKSKMSVERVYQSTGELSTDPSRIWTGKLDWPNYASNELFIALVPEGFGANKPVLALWQWTVNAHNQPKFPCILKGTQKSVSGTDHSLTFSFEDYYTMTCTWEKKTERLAIHMQEPEKHGQDIGPFELSALITPHSHDITPTDPIVVPKELEARYPQPEPSLARIQTPMPFPRTLVETLTHTASFVDQAGYLAKYAVERYTDLDKLYHIKVQQQDASDTQINELKGQVHQLSDENKLEKSKNADLEKRLSEARDAAAAKEAELTRQIHDLQKTISGDKDHDAADHKALDAAHKQIEQQQAEKAQLQKLLDEKEAALVAAQARAQQLSAQITELAAEISNTKAELDVEREHNSELEKTKKALKQNVSKLEADLATAQKSLAQITADLEQVKADCDDKDKIIEGLEAGLVGVKKDRDSKKRAFDELKKKTDAIIQDLEAKLADSKGGACWQPPNNGLFPFTQQTPSPLKQSIDNHKSKSSWARLSPWVGNMSNRGHFFNTLDDADKDARLKSLGVHGNGDWITGFTIQWTNGNSKSYGVLNGAAKYTISQTPDQPIVAANVVTDNSEPRAPYQTVATISFFGFNQKNGYQQIGEYAAPHAFGPWMKGIAQTSLAPALDGTWSLRGLYGYFDGSMDAVGFVWGHDE